MQVNTVEKLASVGAFGLWAALHGWLGWLAVLYKSYGHFLRISTHAGPKC